MNEEYIPGGFILLSRKLLESEILEKPPLYLRVWVSLLLKARHKENKEFKRGEVFISVPDLMKECGYKIGFRMKYPSEKDIRGALDFLVEEKMITKRKTFRGSIIQICNYDLYQNPSLYEKNNSKKTAHEGCYEGHYEGRNEVGMKNTYKQDNEGVCIVDNFDEGCHEGQIEGGMKSDYTQECIKNVSYYYKAKKPKINLDNPFRKRLLEQNPNLEKNNKG